MTPHTDSPPVEPEQRVGIESLFESRFEWKAGAVSGLLAAFAMGLAISLVRLETLRVAIAGLYGFEGSLAVGWAAHLFHGALFGVVFAAILADPGLFGVRDWLWKSVAAGMVYGVVLAVFGAGIIMPIWLGAVGQPPATSIPHVTLPLVAWHLIYGLVLGATFHYLHRD
ncbi:histidine kinase [Haloarchaeobius sp. TZWWS8]|uniref:histidine kinase n=1 Tax=Haloarchaeobius sp. TZWWS8 TaxID=3446121 RepID=UPI003EBA5C0C